MKTETAIEKLTKAGYKIATNGTFYSAYLDGTEITFTSSNGETSKFSCNNIFGLTLKKAMS